jgi:NADPH:quinone reductase-like Zn-dependent oxidoreductase
MHFRRAGAARTIARMQTYLYPDRISLAALDLVERPDPAPGPHDVVLEMRAASINYRDVAIARGDYGAFAAPLVPLSDGAGVVVARGSAVTRFSVGDLVCPVYVPDWIAGSLQEGFARRRLGGPLDGVLAERVRVHEADAVKAPAHLDAVEAATLPIAAVTVWQTLFADDGVRPGDVVAVQGTGGVSLFTVQLARAAGCRVLVVTRSAERHAELERLGADVLDANGDWRARLLALTHGRGVDRFVDVLGDVARLVPLVRVGGTIAIVGFVETTHTTLDLPATIRRGITLRAQSAGSRASFEALVRTLEVTKLRPKIDRVLPFERARDAWPALERGRPFGKVVIAIGGSR